MATKCPLDGSESSANPAGRPPALKPEHIAVLCDIVAERAQASLQEIADELHHRCGVHVCDATIRRVLRAQGIVRIKPARRVYEPAPGKGGKRYGYEAAHRREDVSPYSTNLTDAEWELVADLFERVPGSAAHQRITAGAIWSTHAAMFCARVRLAATANDIPTLAGSLQSICALGKRWCVRAKARSAARAMALKDGAPERTNCGGY